MASRNNAFDIPKPESSIADWASKIRDMQRQVDADEEAEQRKLEEEIAASRMKRMSRRSHATPAGSNSLDLSKSKESLSTLDKDDSPSDAEPKSPLSRQSAQSDALQKLSGGNGPQTPSNPVPQRSSPLPPSRSEPMSLAAFMGGRATGPRLNKHAPQQDGNDHTQFAQRSVGSIQSAPHPIFGRGGVGLPGMAKPAHEETPNRSLPQTRPFKPSVTAQPATPPPKSSVTPDSPKTPQKYNPSYTAHLATSQPPSKESPSLVSGEKTTPVQSKYPGKTSSTPATPVKFPVTPSSSPAKGLMPTATLARPVLPAAPTPPRTPPSSVSKTPVASLQRSSTPKELTPSLSRLQGRGFVQNMVKASATLNTLPSPDPSPVSRPSSAGGRKASVLDRWQPQTPPSPTSERESPRPLRKSWTVDNPKPTLPSPTQITERPHLKSSVSVGQLNGTAAPVKLPAMGDPARSSPGLGSKSTIVVMQPAQGAGPPSQVASAIDEFGSRMSRPSIAQPAPGKPLVHPTRDRAKPARNKHKTSPAAQKPGSPIEPPSVPKHPTLPPKSISPPASQPEAEPEAASGSLADRWGGQPIIGLKTNGSSSTPSVAEPKPASTAIGGKIALPGLSATVPEMVSVKQSVSPTLAEVVKPSPREPPTSPSSGIGLGSPPRERSPRHTRIPSTGNRATVMDLAQAMQSRSVDSVVTPPMSPLVAELPANTEEPRTPTKSRSNVGSTASPLERRRSTIEPASSLFPLPEEATPAPSPAVTLTRSAGMEITSEPLSTVDSPVADQPVTQEEDTTYSGILQEPLPDYNAQELFESAPRIQGGDHDTTTISIEVMSITGTSASTVDEAYSNVFYDTEVLAIVRRYKSKSTGLVGTVVWGWIGRKAQWRELERRKLNELARRYGTTPILINQCLEPLDVLSYIKQPLSIRQGTRAHWSAENTAMHLARELSNGLIVLDEHDLHVQNLCSGFSYCISLLNTQYVWHGKGARPLEREAARALAQQLAANPQDVVEMEEGDHDPEDMFWMMLGDDDFAKADYWRWRGLDLHQARFYLVDHSNPQKLITLFDESRLWDSSSAPVFLVDCIWELFVVISPDARANRSAIRFAIAVAEDFSSLAASLRPFAPPVHVVGLPSLLPLDLKLAWRGIDEISINNNAIPDHMNVLPSRDALSIMTKRSWEEPSWAVAMPHLFI